MLNATPVGMRTEDPFPVQVEHLSSTMFVGDMITAPAVVDFLPGVQDSTGTGREVAIRGLP